jgi:hypothetical protein
LIGSASRIVAIWFAATFMLAGCQSTQVMTGANGTKLQARDVVRLVYGQSGEPGSPTLTYFAGDITPAVRRMMERFPHLRGALESGRVGLTADAYLAVRESQVAGESAGALVRADNLDRVVLYAASAMEAGHGSNDRFGDWMPYERATFAREWRAQAPAGWWYRDERGAWQRTPEVPAASPEPTK